MNEYILYTLAQVATTLAGFSGLWYVRRHCPSYGRLPLAKRV